MHRTEDGFSPPLFEGDTRDALSCPGTALPTNNRGFHVRFGTCFGRMTFVGEDGLPDTPDDIVIDTGEIGVGQDKSTGEINAIRLWLYDAANVVYYKTDILPVTAKPDPVYFRIDVNLDDLPVIPHALI